MWANNIGSQTDLEQAPDIPDLVRKVFSSDFLTLAENHRISDIKIAIMMYKQSENNSFGPKTQWAQKL